MMIITVISLLIVSPNRKAASWTHCNPTQTGHVYLPPGDGPCRTLPGSFESTMEQKESCDQGR